MNKRIALLLACILAAMVGLFVVGCANGGSGSSAAPASSAPASASSSEVASSEPASSEAASSEAASSEAASSEAPAEEEEEVDNTIKYDDVDITEATAAEVQAFMSDDDPKTVLLDARTQEAYAGWALEGAANGGHLKNAGLYSMRWIDCEYAGRTPRQVTLDRQMADQGVTSDASVIVYDYTGEQAPEVAKYLVSKGIKDVKSFKANELIDAGTDLVSYENYQMFVPVELVKSVSDVKTGKADSLSDEAKAVFGDNVDNIIIFDNGWGNAFTSSYFSVGHVPGAIHMNSDTYERPRVYVSEKRSDYAKEWRKIPLEEFRDQVCPRYGITKDTVAILTGNSTACYARFGFYLRALGVKTYCMNGMLTAWKYAGYELDTAEDTLVVPTAVEETGLSEINSEEYDTDMVKAILAGEREGQIVDNRGKEEWDGEYSGYAYHDLAGRIDGSYWCCQGDEEGGEYFENLDGTPRTQEEYQKYLTDNGLDTTKDMVFFCGDSWGASMIAYWCNSVDIPTVKVWTTGWIPWSNEGNEFIDHNGVKVHYDCFQDAVLDENGKNVSDGTNWFIPEEEPAA